VRLADAILRRGHLSEQALIEFCLTGERSDHLDRCDICAQRAVELGRWLDDVRTMGVEEADATLSAERLGAQQTQILRRLEQLDRPARVIAFPGRPKDRLEAAGHGIRPAWVGIAAAAGVVLGLVGGQVTTRLTTQRAPARAPVQVQQPASPGAVPTPAVVADMFSDLDLDDRTQVDAMAAFEEYTPHMLARSEQLVLRTSRVLR
jgi:hypothetical protein